MGNSNSNSNDGAVAGAGAGAAGGEQKTAQQGPETEVFLNVYQPKDPNQAQVPGFGVYHSGLEVFGTEYTYAGAAGSGTGVYSQRVKWQPADSPWKFYQTVSLGKIRMTKADLLTLLAQIKRDFPANEYHLLNKNCNTFTCAFATALGLKSAYPSWVNRAASVGSTFSGLIPKSVAEKMGPGGAGYNEYYRAEEDAAKLEIKHPENVRINDLVQVASGGCLNSSAQTSLKDALAGDIYSNDAKRKRTVFLESAAPSAASGAGGGGGVAAQMLLTLPFSTVVKVASVAVTLATGEAEAALNPAYIKVFKNCKNLGFAQARDETIKPIVLLKVPSPQEVWEQQQQDKSKSGKAPPEFLPANLELPFVKFQDVSSLCLFVVGGSSKTVVRLRDLTIIGRESRNG